MQFVSKSHHHQIVSSAFEKLIGCLGLVPIRLVFLDTWPLIVNFFWKQETNAWTSQLQLRWKHGSVFHSSIAKPRISALHLLNLERGKPKAAEKCSLAHPALTAQNLNTKTLHVGQPRLCKMTAADIGLFLALPHSLWCSLQALPVLITAPYTHSQKSFWMLSGELSQLWPPDQNHHLPYYCLKAVTVVRCLLI